MKEQFIIIIIFTILFIYQDDYKDQEFITHYLLLFEAQCSLYLNSDLI